MNSKLYYGKDLRKFVKEVLNIYTFERQLYFCWFILEFLAYLAVKGFLNKNMANMK